MASYLKHNQVIVIDSEKENSFSNHTNHNFFDHDAKSLVIIGLNDGGNGLNGCIVFSMINEHRTWREDEIIALHELSKGINVYLNKEQIFNKLDSLLVTYNRVMERLNDAIVIFSDEDTPKLMFINNAGRHFLGDNCAYGNDLTDLFFSRVNPRYHDRIYDGIHRCIQTGEEQIVTYEFKKISGRTVEVKSIFNLSPVKERGNPVIISINTGT